MRRVSWPPATFLDGVAASEFTGWTRVRQVTNDGLVNWTTLQFADPHHPHPHPPHLFFSSSAADKHARDLVSAQINHTEGIGSLTLLATSDLPVQNWGVWKRRAAAGRRMQRDPDRNFSCLPVVQLGFQLIPGAISAGQCSPLLHPAQTCFCTPDYQVVLFFFFPAADKSGHIFTTVHTPFWHTHTQNAVPSNPDATDNGAFKVNRQSDATSAAKIRKANAERWMMLHTRCWDKGGN